MAVFAHADGLQGPVYAAANLLALDAQIFGAEGDVVLDNRGNHLVVGILKDYTRVAAHFEDIFLVGKVKAPHGYAALVGLKQTADEAGQSRLARTVVADYGDKFALSDVERHVIYGGRLRFGIPKFYVFE